MTHTEAAPPLHWDGTRLRILDQTRLPAEEVVLELTGADDTAEAIKRLAVRGAPLIGIAAAYGLAMEVTRSADYEGAAARLAATRPTARNLAWAVGRVLLAARAGARRRRAPRRRRSSARTSRPAPRWPPTAPTRSTRSSPPAL
jgi:methylthioribose-1-phosphate isomerase